MIVEGNRRLAALKLLSDPKLRNKLSESEEWETLAPSLRETQFPVEIVADRETVAPLIGYRHIAGIEPWDAYAKARYIAEQVEKGLEFERVASEVGETTNEVRANYRNFMIKQQAEEAGIDVSEIEEQFGFFTRAMQTGNIARFIGAPNAAEVVKERQQIPANKIPALKELVKMMYGDSKSVPDSRDLTRFGKVLASNNGLKVLRETGDLEEAEAASGGQLERLKNYLSTAIKNLANARNLFDDYKNDNEIKELLEECKQALEDLQ